jgi:hypothetical protein
MSEHLFGVTVPRPPTTEDAAGPDYGSLLHELRCHTTEWLLEYRGKAIREQRGARLRELAATAVLDERGRVDDTLAAADGVSLRALHETVETARVLEELPAVAAAAGAGRISDEQLAAVTRLADASTDQDWAQRAATTSPVDLQRELRATKVPSAEDLTRRRARRSLRWWWNPERTMLCLRGELPDLDGVVVERVLDHMVERLRPGTGQRWEPRDRRGADALVDLCASYADAPATVMPEPLIVFHARAGEPLTVAGIPLPCSLLEGLLPNAKFQTVVEDDDGTPREVGTVRTISSAKVRRAVLRRDGKCRIPGCEHRHRLQVHHLWPRSWGGRDDFANLAAVCPKHHTQLAPHGRYLLLGNPNRTDGLRWVPVERLPHLAGEAGGSDPRAGPETG